MPEMTDRVGQQLGNYRLTRLLGRGGFAEVYLGEHIYLKSLAAVKMLYARLTEEDLRHFLQEAQIIVKLQHSHIVRIIDFGIEGGGPGGEGGLPFLVMEFAPNGTLRQRHPSGVALPLTTILTYVRQIASALQYAHDQKLIHRDVKPENLFLDWNNAVLLGDFGTALVAPTVSIQNTGETAGTVAYMAPEQLHGKPRYASDQYALGVIVYEWLCGDRPFHGSFFEVASQHVLVPPPPLREKVPGIPPGLEEVVLTAMAKEPQRRFANVRAFANALEQAAMGNQNLATLQAPAPSLPSSLSERTPSSPPVIFERSTNTPPSISPIHFAAQAPLKAETRKMAEQAPAAGPAIVASTVEQSVQTPAPTHPLKQNRRGVSRRTLLIGLGAVGTAAVFGGGIVWWEFLRKPAIGTTLHTFPAHADGITGVAWSPPDGKQIVTSSFDSTVKVWDVATEKLVYLYHGYAASVAVKCVAWAPSGSLVCSGGDDKKVQVWDTATGMTIATFTGHPNFIDAGAWSPDGQRIASADEGGHIYVWYANNGQEIIQYKGHTTQVWSLEWSPDGSRIASGDSQGHVDIWDPSSGSTIRTYLGHVVTPTDPADRRQSLVRSVAWSPDGQRIVSAGYDYTVQVWDAHTGNQLYVYKGHTAHDPNVLPYVDSARWSPDGSRIASSGGDRTVQVWNAVDGSNPYIYTNHHGYVYHAAWSPDGQYIASVDSTGVMYVWQAV